MRIASITVALLLVAALLFGALAEGDVAKQYAEASRLLQAGDYYGASEAFSELGNYEDASRLAMYCQAIAAGESGFYSLAVTNLNKLDGFRDSALQANYYAALSYEAAEEYEKAREMFGGMELFRDVSDRLAAYPGKIRARDYARADQAEQAGRLEEALEGFKALGSWSDSAQRAEAVQQKICARDYTAADTAEQNGDYSAAYKGFVALGNYADSAARAAAVQNRANYARAMQCARDGKYAEAYRLFKELGDYEDSAKKAYVLSVTEFANVSDRKNGMAAFRFHDVWGVLDIDGNNVSSPVWDEIGDFNELGLAKVTMFGEPNSYGYINTQGEVVVPCKYSAVSEYRGNRCTVAINTGSYARFGLVDEKGDIVSEPVWKTLGGSYGQGYMPIENSIEAPAFSDGKIKVQGADDKWGFIDEDGQPVGEVRWAEIQDFSEDLAVVCENGKYGFIDRNGDVIIDPQYQDARSFHEGLAAVRKETNRWQYIDPRNEVVIPPLYSEALDFRAGRADVYKSGEGWQIIDKSGAMLYFIGSRIEKEYQDAVELLEGGNWDEARELFLSLNGYEDSGILAQKAEADGKYAEGKIGKALSIYSGLPEEYRTHSYEQLYAEAVRQSEAGEYDAATETFNSIAGYEDAADRAQECQYQKGIAQREAGEYDAATETFNGIAGYRDAADQAQECQYQKGINLYAAGAYEEAYLAFAPLSGYKDVDAMLTNDPNLTEVSRLRCAVGDQVAFGRFEQDNDTSNGPEPIEWIVLNVEDARATLISRYALINMGYNQVREDTNWEKCSLRQWLNGEFYDQAFSPSEQMNIVTATVTAGENHINQTDQGQDTEDRVYLLGLSEAQFYYSSDAQRRCEPTEYCASKGVKAKNGSTSWWLRTMGAPQGAVGVNNRGQIILGGWYVEEGMVSVRPVIQVRVDAASPEAEEVKTETRRLLPEADMVTLLGETLDDPSHLAAYQALLTDGPITKGSKGDAVKALQQMLVDFGQDIIADGDAGSRTIAALNDVRAAFGLEKTDGVDATGYAQLLRLLLAHSDRGAAEALQAQYGIYGDDADFQEICAAADALG